MSETKYVTKEQFDESIKALERKMKKMNAPPRPPREPNDYNRFMKEQMVKVKSANLGISNTDAFKKCAEDWNKGKEGKEGKETKKVSKPVEKAEKS
jgi:hypothetical protein